MSKYGKPGNLTAKQAAAIHALMTARDAKAAAALCGVAYRTVCRWLTQPEFQAALREAQRIALDTTVRRLAELSGAAVDTLRDVMRDEVTPGVKVRAADVSLSQLMRLSELADLEARITALEAAAQKDGTP